LWPPSGKPQPKPIPKFVVLHQKNSNRREDATPWDGY